MIYFQVIQLIWIILLTLTSVPVLNTPLEMAPSMGLYQKSLSRYVNGSSSICFIDPPTISLSARSVFECTTECIKRSVENCTAFNYFTRNNTCHLYMYLPYRYTTGIDCVNYQEMESKKRYDLSGCPSGFVRITDQLPHCYHFASSSWNFTEIQSYCENLHPPGSYMTNMQSQLEQSSLENYTNHYISGVALTGVIDKPTMLIPGIKRFHQGGRRAIINNCSTNIYWQPRSTDAFIPLTYTNWYASNPSCAFIPATGEYESCINFNQVNNYKWNDIACSAKLNSICKFDL